MECILALSKKKKVCGMPSYLLPFFSSSSFLPVKKETGANACGV
jgi:hypothetical protein